jgi:hypothetical protein
MVNPGIDDQLTVDEHPNVIVADEGNRFGASEYKRSANLRREAKIVVGTPLRQILGLIAEPSVV